MKVLYFLMFLMTITGALAIPIDANNQTQIDYIESRITAFNNTYVINWSEDGQQHRANASERYGVRLVRGKSPYMIEIDPHFAQVLTIKNNESLELRLIENPNNPYPNSTVPLRACVNGIEIMNAKRFETDIPYCESEKEYFIGNLKFDVTYTVRFTTSMYNTNFSYIWWLGEDDLDGTFGQGGGLPTCDFSFGSMNLNQTKTWVNSTFRMGMKADFSGTGCAIPNRLEEQNLNNVPAWRVISTAFPSNTNVWCKSFSCTKSAPAWNTWYYRTIQCTEPGNRSLRVAIFSIDLNIHSPVQVMECLSVPVITAEDGGAWFIYFIPFAIFAGGYYFVMRTKKHEKER